MREKVCPECGKAFMPKSNAQKYCSQTCSRKQYRDVDYIMGKQKWKARNHAAENIYMAYRSQCAVCGWHLSKAHYHSQMSGGCEIHHITPSAKGGSDDYSNLILICPNCHREAHEGNYSEEFLHQHQVADIEKAVEKRKEELRNINAKATSYIARYILGD